ncbi:MAG: glycosyltransferase family 1 protein [Acidobacteria bacterium]|nr:MAG: glycosyltransferase family 1 protein [Acidobacteriota bacterium]
MVTRRIPQLELHLGLRWQTLNGASLCSHLVERWGGNPRASAPMPSPARSNVLPLFAMVSTDLRRDLLAPISHINRLRVRHLYRLTSYGDLTPDDLSDGSLAAYKSSFDLLRQLWKCRPDIVQTVEPFSLRLLPCQFAVYLATLLRRTPLLVVTLENRPLTEKYGKWFAFLLRTVLRPIFRSARAIVYLNQGAARNVLQIGPYATKSKWLMYGTWGIDPSEFTPEGDRQQFNLGPGPLLLFVGRLHREKGVFDLLEAFTTIQREMPSASLALVGDGPERAAIEREITQNHWSSRVFLTGVVKNRDLPAYFRSADVFVAPSITTQKWEEQVGMSIIQAMASGVAVVSTRSGAIPEYLPESAGILVDERDPAALAAAVVRMVREPDMRRQMGEYGRRYAVEHYDARKNVNVAEEFILRCCET